VRRLRLPTEPVRSDPVEAALGGVFLSMKLGGAWRRVLLSALAIFACAVSGLAVYLRIEDRRLGIQLQRVLIESHDNDMREGTIAINQPKPSALLDAPINEKTALSFYWFGDMDSHFRNPIDFYVLSVADHRLHSVDFKNPDTVSTFISSAEMKNITETLKSIGLRWVDSRGREELKNRRHRRDDGFLDITFVTQDSTTKAYFRIATMCAQLAKLDTVMPTRRILWQFRTFRWDNGCEVPGYKNYDRPPE
jgi:hypothetical protein